jgi:transcription elongation factor GreA
MPNEILMTAEGYENLKNELENLKTTKRRDISEKIRIPRGFGDLSRTASMTSKNDRRFWKTASRCWRSSLKLSVSSIWTTSRRALWRWALA